MEARNLKYKLILVILAGIAFQYLNAQNYSISGYVEDVHTGERLIGAFITDSINKEGTQTNNYGFFSLRIAKGPVTVKATYVGYKPQKINIALLNDTSFEIKLTPVAELQEVVIKAGLYNRNVSTPIGTVLIPVGQLKSIPALGETDVLKAIQLQPGIQGGIEGSAGLFVRGGGAGENLFMIDDVPVYNVSHLYGFLSTFNSSAVKDIKVIKGCFPASYGGRVSSVIDVRSRDGNNQSHKGEISLGLISSKIMLEGPLFSHNTTFMVSGRRSYLDLFTNLLKKTGLMDKSFPRYYFYDVNAKLVHTFSMKDRIYLSFYNGKDHILNQNETLEENGEQRRFKETTKETSGWGNLLGSLRWNHNSGRSLFVNTTLAYSKYNYFTGRNYNSTDRDVLLNTNITRDYQAKYTSRIQDLIFKTDLSYSITSKQMLRFGAGNTFHTIEPGTNLYAYDDELLGEKSDTSYTNASIRANEYYLYADYEINLGRKTTADLGIRGSGFISGATGYFIPQPRVSLNYLWLPNLAFKAGYSRMEQYIHLLTSSGVSMPTDIWIPSTNHIKPLYSDQVNAGFTYDWKSRVVLSVEVYQKWLNHTADYRDGASLSTDLRPWYEKVAQGQGTSKGLEISVEKQQGRITGGISYTLSKADRKYSEINNGRVFPFNYDRRHNLNLFVNYTVSAKWDISAAWVYGTGYPATIPVEKYMPAMGIYNIDSEYGGEIDYYPSRNNVRMPAYHRLDLGVHYKVQNRLGENMVSIDIFNVYNRKNPVYMYFSGYRAKTIAYANLLPIIPSLAYTLRF